MFCSQCGKQVQEGAEFCDDCETKIKKTDDLAKTEETKNNYVEFDPQPTWGQNTNGVNMVYKILNEKDQSWTTQDSSSYFEWACPGGNGYFAAVAAHTSDEDKKSLDLRKQALKKLCSKVAEFVKKDYDVTVSRTVEKERTVTIDVPKERKVGLFKKEQYIDHETKTEKYKENETITYKGWRLERLVRKKDEYVCGHIAYWTYFDYCLGANGQLYLVVSEHQDRSESDLIYEPSEHVLVLNCLCYSPAFLASTFYNVYSAVISGAIGALDAIPIDENDSLRNVNLELDDGFYYNFPIQIDNVDSFTYGFLSGVIERVVNLLDDAGKEACCQKYEYMKSFLYPEDQVSTVDKAEASTAQQGSSNLEKNNLNDIPITTDDFDVEIYALIAAKAYGQHTGDIDYRFVQILIQFRTEVAKVIASKHQEFMPIYEFFKENRWSPDFNLLLDELVKTSHLIDDMDYAILLAAFVSFMERSADSDLPVAYAETTIKAIQASGGEITEVASMFLFCTVLWFSDYRNFKERVYENIKKLVSENWYSEKAEIDLENVKRVALK